MKKLSAEQKARLERVRKERERHRRRAREPRIMYRPGWMRRTNQLPVPEVLDLEGNYEITMAFIDEIRVRTLKERQNVFLDFSQTKSIDPGAGVVLTAEVQRARTFGRSRIHGSYPKNRDIEQFLADLGFYQQIGVVTRVPAAAETDRAQLLAIKSGIKDQGAAIESLRDMVFSDVVTLDDKAAKFVYRALSEAMSNVSRHAYDPTLGRDLPVLAGRWWMAGRWDRSTKEIMAIFYDQGVGIPASLPMTFPEVLKAVLAFIGMGDSDGPMIRAAMEIGRTRTGKEYRGKGLNDLRRVIDFAEAGSLRITSGRGRYEYTGNDNETAIDLPRSIGGTLIEWRISGSEAVIWKDGDESH